jgi:HAD superfamily hydrolase (TIGR01549 family)
MNRPIEAVLFDLDGVLVHSPLDLPAIKRELFGDDTIFIIEGLERLEGDELREKEKVLLERELEAAADAMLDPEVVPLFEWLEERLLKRGVITRNAREVVELIARNHLVDFGAIIARQDAPPKPDPASVLAACEILMIDPGNAVMVGDFTFDIEAGRAAGCRTVFLETEKFRHLEPEADARVRSLGELRELLEEWMDSSFSQ